MQVRAMLVRALPSACSMHADASHIAPRPWFGTRWVQTGSYFAVTRVVWLGAEGYSSGNKELPSYQAANPRSFREMIIDILARPRDAPSQAKPSHSTRIMFCPGNAAPA